jgi:PAS domain S-box-containing protein
MNKYRILYVEDNPTDFEMVKAILEEADMLEEIRQVEKKEELEQAFENFAFDLLLTDYSLPVFHGLEAIRITKERFPYKPIIMITGNLPDELAVDVIKKGAWDYVLKENVYRLIPSIEAVIERQLMVREKTQALEALKEREENYRVLAEASPYAIVVHTNGKVLYHNRKALSIFSQVESNSEIALDDFVDPKYTQIIEKRLHELHFDIKNIGTSQLKYNNFKNEEITFEVTSSPVQFNKIPAAQVIFRDISGQKKLEDEIIKAKEKAEESDRLKTAFLENLSHEIRTPLNGIIGFASLLKIKEISEVEKINFLNTIEDSANLLMVIIEGLIEISKIEAGHTDIRLAEFNLNEIINELFIFFNDGTRYKNFPILLSASKGERNEDAFIISDKSRIKQIFNNLLSNAFKFTSSGRIDFGYKYLPNDKIRFYVKDTGIGIPESAGDTIFERFRQLDNSNTRKFGGTGLGLTISRAIVNSLKGNIWYESIPDQGSTFYFEIPIKHIADGKPEERNHAKQIVYHWNQMKVLIAEDELSNFILLKHILSKTGISITHVENGKQVLEVLKKGEKFDLLLLDIKMPVLDGIQTAKLIRQNKYKIPILAQTAYAMADDREKCLEAGCDDYLTKPIKTKELLSKINDLISN